MPSLNKVHKLRKYAEQFCRIETTADLADALHTPQHVLALLAMQPPYKTFSIPKKDGSLRHIEDPAKPLKKIQQSLNDYFQSCYYCHRTRAAYGFLVNPADDPDPRNILTNAQQHAGKPWMLNMDFEDFFHSVSSHAVCNLLLSDLFSFDLETADLLARLTTNLGRLPMGAPTSPVLSNFAAMALDHDLLAFAHAHHWTYTRFADDLTFSSDVPIDQHSILEIKALAQIHGFTFNDQKFRLCSPSAEKSVTGLALMGKEVCLPTDYFAKVEAEIAKLRSVVEIQHRAGKPPTPWVEEFKEQLLGYFRFASFIVGDDDPAYRKALRLYETATEPPSGFDAVSWLSFDYVFFTSK